MEATPQSYALATLPEPYRILGLRLRPLSIGHCLLMQRFGCAFIGEGETTKDDLILGVLICSMRHGEFLEFIEQKDFTKEVRDWGKKCGVFDIPEKSKLFAQYLRESLTPPIYISIQPSDGSGDWIQNLKITLTTKLAYSEAQVMDAPLTQAHADYYKFAEQNGLVRLLTAEDVAAGEANEKAFAELAKQREAACPA